MYKRKLIIVVPAVVLLLITLFFFQLGIRMVVEYPPNHHDFKEGLLALIPSAIMLVVIPLISWLLLKLDWFNDGAKTDFCCPDCGYNMAGLSATKCPECGSTFTIDQLKKG